MPGGGLMAAAGTDALGRLRDVQVPGRPRVLMAFGDWRASIASRDVDAIHNCRRTALCIGIKLAPIKQGKHVLSEKPLTTSFEEGRELLRAARSAGSSKTNGAPVT
jgi:predicted dehydrogenase